MTVDETRRKAQHVAKKIGAHGKTRRRRSAYLCSFCGYWHVGTSRGVGRRR